MEPTISGIRLVPILKNNIRRQVNRRCTIKSQLSVQVLYTIDELKMLLFLCFVNRFEERRVLMINKCEEEAERKLKKREMHFNKLSSTITIEPINKKVVELNNIREILEQIQKLLVMELKNSLMR
jgi:hypothetical protein